MVKTVIISYLMLVSGHCLSQSPAFPQMGQLPSNAFPLCTLDTFRQLIIPYGSGGFITIPGCGKVEARNPYYYSFNCYAGGNLALLIEPLDAEKDYNWELFDITGRNPDEILTDPSLAITGNWSGTPGRTGARNNGNPATLCLSAPSALDSTFSAMPTLIQGRHYILLVSGYSKTQSDYMVSFAGSTAGITDPEAPRLKSAYTGCNRKIITVVTSKQMRCFSLAADGSDFSLNSGNVAITAATGLHCNDQFDFDSLQLTLSDTLPPGNYSLVTKRGSDEKNLWDNCFNEVPEGDQISFTVPPSGAVAADFDYQIGYGCKSDTIYFKYSVTNGSFQSQWFMDSVFSSSLFEPVVIKSDFGPMQVQHVVSNGYCSDTVSKTVDPGNILKAGIGAPVSVCPADPVTFTDSSIGNIVSWNWDFGDGTGSNLQNPPAHLFPDKPGEHKYLVELAIENNLGCMDTASASLTRLQTCYTEVPNAFTPNGDGKNDYLFPLNLPSATDMQFLVFNRYGQLVFETRNESGKWDGTIHGIAQPTGSYIWVLRYTDGSSGKKIFLRGISVLIR